MARGELTLNEFKECLDMLIASGFWLFIDMYNKALEETQSIAKRKKWKIHVLRSFRKSLKEIFFDEQDSAEALGDRRGTKGSCIRNVYNLVIVFMEEIITSRFSEELVKKVDQTVSRGSL